MFDIGFWELLLIAIVALVVVGPERLPKLVRVVGLWVGRANASIQSIRSEISQELRAEELKQSLNKTIDLSDIDDSASINLITKKKTNTMTADKQQPLISHLIELRDRLLRSILAVAVITICLLPFSNDLYSFISEPLLKHLPETSTMIATEVASTFLIPFKLTLSFAVLLAVPIILYQFWAFIAPGLYDNEKKAYIPIIICQYGTFFSRDNFCLLCRLSTIV